MSDTKQIAEWLRGHGLDARSMHPTEHVLIAHHHVALGLISPLYKSAQRDKARIAELEALVNAIERGDYGAIAFDVAGKNWFDVRDKVLKGETS